MASSCRSLATVVPPISSITMSTSFARTTSNASEITCAFLPTFLRANATALSATLVIWMARPARRWTSSALRLSTSHVPPPTVPMPSSPTLIGFISFQAGLEVALDVRPFGCQHAVHHGIAYRAIAPRPVVPDHPVLLRSQRFDRALRGQVEIVGAQAHDLAAQCLEGVREKQQLAGAIDVAALPALRVPGVADLDAIGLDDDVVVARAACYRAAFLLAHRPGQHVAFFLSVEGFFNIGARLPGLGHGSEPQFP